MNTSELLERAEIALMLAKTELALVDDTPSHVAIQQRKFVRRSVLVAVQRVLDAMRATLTAIPVVAALVLGAGQAKAADQTAAIAKAEQKVELATCQLNFLQQRPGAKKNDREYFGFMFQCLSK